MNKIGIYYAYWTNNWHVEFHPFIDKAANIGFDILEVNAGTIVKITPAERRALKDHAADKDILLTYCIGLPQEYDIASMDASIRKNGIDYLQQIARAIGEMGGGVLGGIIYGSWPAAMPSGDNEKRILFDHSVRSMQTAIRAAEENNVTFNIEVVNRFEQFLINTCEEAIEYIDAVGSPNIRVMLDTFHMNIEEDVIDGAVLKAGSKLGHVHIGENNRMPPGHGHIPWTAFSKALRKINYSGFIVMEPFLMPGGEVGRDIKVYRDMRTGMDMDEEAKKALLFIRGILN